MNNGVYLFYVWKRASKEPFQMDFRDIESFAYSPDSDIWFT